MTARLFGLLNVDKPAGMTSRNVVNVVQRMAGKNKVGHAGTLDPLATGVLVLCLGQATRLIEYVQRMPKSYRGKFLLGRSSPTEDVEGEVTILPEPRVPTRDEIETAATALTGEVQQRPPSYSALKIGGRRAYNLARAGKQVELKPRPVTIYQLEVVAYSYPELTLDVRCSSGTYVRSLGRDLAESVGSAAVMSALTRTAIGSFHIDDAISLDAVTPENLESHLSPAAHAVEALPKIVLDRRQELEIANGRWIVCDESPKPQPAEVAAIDAEGQLLAILAPQPRGKLKPSRVFVSR